MKHNLKMQQDVGLVIMSSIGSLFSKDASKGLHAALGEGIEKINEMLAGEDDEEEDEYETYMPKRKRKGKKITPKKIMAMAEKFHAQFGAFMSKTGGAGVPSLRGAIADANRIQQNRSQMQSTET